MPEPALVVLPNPAWVRHVQAHLPTPQSLAILQLLAEGNKQDEAATRMHLSARHTKWLIHQAAVRLGGKNALHTTAIAIARGLIPGVRP